LGRELGGTWVFGGVGRAKEKLAHIKRVLSAKLEQFYKIDIDKI